MQEELENRTVTLIVSSSKFTGRTMKSAISHFLNYSKHKVQDHKNAHKNVVPHGKQSVKDLIGQNAGVENADMGDDANMRSFDRIARKYGVDYAVKKVERDGKPQFMIFFKSRDRDAILAAMSDYANNFVKKGREERPSIRKLLAMLKGMREDKDRAVSREISR